MGSISQGCPLVWFLSLHFMLLGADIWKASKESLLSFYADNLKCNSYDVDDLLAAAQYTVSYVKVVGQEASPTKCILLP